MNSQKQYEIDGVTTLVDSSLSVIQELKQSRLPDIFRLPDHLIDPTWDIDTSRVYTVSDSAEVTSKGTHCYGDNIVKFSPSTGGPPSFTHKDRTTQAEPRNMSESGHFLWANDVLCVEHLLALRAATGIEVDYSLSKHGICLLYTSPSPRDKRQSRMPSSA